MIRVVPDLHFVKEGQVARHYALYSRLGETHDPLSSRRDALSLAPYRVALPWGSGVSAERLFTSRLAQA